MLSFSEIVASEEVALIFESGLADRKSLTSTQRIRFDFLFSALQAFEWVPEGAEDRGGGGSEAPAMR